MLVRPWILRSSYFVVSDLKFVLSCESFRPSADSGPLTNHLVAWDGKRTKDPSYSGSDDRVTFSYELTIRFDSYNSAGKYEVCWLGRRTSLAKHRRKGQEHSGIHGSL